MATKNSSTPKKSSASKSKKPIDATDKARKAAIKDIDKRIAANAAADETVAPKATEKAPRAPKAPKAATAPAKAKAAKVKAPKAKRVGALDAAAQALAINKDPMTCADMVTLMREKGLWTSPGGKTPEATLYAAIIREIAKKGSEARFRKVERGMFEANPTAT